MKKGFALVVAAILVLGLFSACGTKALQEKMEDMANSAATGDAPASANTGVGTGDAAAPSAGKATSYAEAYNQAAEIQAAMVNLMTELNDKRNSGLADDDMTNTDSVMYTLMLMSLDMAFTASFNEDPNTIAGVQAALAMLGAADATAERVAANQYRITYTDNEGVKKELNALFDPATGSYRFSETENGTPGYFFDFVNLGGGRYAYQTGNERCFAVYENGEIKSFAYSALPSDPGYAMDADGIYPAGGGTSEAWVTEAGIDDYPQVYIYDGKTLTMHATPVFGEKFTVEMTK